jgi:hypothetical protein
MKMKRYFGGIFILILLVTPPAFSQKNDLFLRKNVFAINMFSLVRRPVVQDTEAYYPVIFHGILYTRDIGKGYFLRARFDYFQRNRDNSTETNMNINLYSDIQMGGAWGHHFGDGIVVPYLAADLMMTSVLRYSETGGVDAGTYRKIQTRRLGGSLMPLAGLTFHVSPILSFSLETNVELGYAREKGTDFTWGEDKVPIEKDILRDIFFARWNPVSLLSIELNF